MATGHATGGRLSGRWRLRGSCCCLWRCGVVAARLCTRLGLLVLPMIPGMPVTVGMLVVLATVVIGAYSALVWLRNTI